MSEQNNIALEPFSCPECGNREGISQWWYDVYTRGVLGTHEGVVVVEDGEHGDIDKTKFPPGMLQSGFYCDRCYHEWTDEGVDTEDLEDVRHKLSRRQRIAALGRTHDLIEVPVLDLRAGDVQADELRTFKEFGPGLPVETWNGYVETRWTTHNAIVTQGMKLVDAVKVYRKR